MLIIKNYCNFVKKITFMQITFYLPNKMIDSGKFITTFYKLPLLPIFFPSFSLRTAIKYISTKN